MESLLNEENAFITLTYSDEHLPENGTLVSEDLQLFIKKLRWHFRPLKVRYFAVGEYGDTTFRPHYHLALFNYPSCRRGRTDPHRRNGCCDVCERIKEIWGKGKIEVAELNIQTAQYISGYVVKKIRKLSDEEIQDLSGRSPEFARMSRRPGLGAGMVPDLASALLTNRTGEPEHLPYAVQMSRKRYVLGRYLRNLLRKHLGISDDAWKTFVDELTDEKMQAMREATKALPKEVKGEVRKNYFKNLVIDEEAGKAAQVSYRYGRNRGRHL